MRSDLTRAQRQPHMLRALPGSPGEQTWDLTAKRASREASHLNQARRSGLLAARQRSRAPGLCTQAVKLKAAATPDHSRWTGHGWRLGAGGSPVPRTLSGRRDVSIEMYVLNQAAPTPTRSDTGTTMQLLGRGVQKSRLMAPPVMRFAQHPVVQAHKHVGNLLMRSHCYCRHTQVRARAISVQPDPWGHGGSAAATCPLGVLLTLCRVRACRSAMPAAPTGDMPTPNHAPAAPAGCGHTQSMCGQPGSNSDRAGGSTTCKGCG